MQPAAALRRVLWITLSSILLGAFFGHLESQALGGDPDGAGLLRGAVDGALIGGTLATLETYLLGSTAGTPFRQLPFLPYLVLRSLIYLGVILLMLLVGHRLT